MRKNFLLICGLFLFAALSAKPLADTIKISDDLFLIRVSPNIWMHVSYTNSAQWGRFSSNGLIYYQDGEALLFDTPATNDLTRQLVEFFRQTFFVTFTGFVPNHWHEDCMGGLEYLLEQKVPAYANQRTIDIALAKNLPVPDNAFIDSLRLNTGSATVLCWFPGAAHTSDNIVVWIPAEKVLFAGCMAKENNAGNMGNVVDGDLPEWPVTIRKIMVRFPDAKVVIPGHGRAGGTEILQHTLDLLGKI